MHHAIPFVFSHKQLILRKNYDTQQETMFSEKDII